MYAPTCRWAAILTITTLHILCGLVFSRCPPLYMCFIFTKVLGFASSLPSIQLSFLDYVCLLFVLPLLQHCLSPVFSFICLFFFFPIMCVLSLEPLCVRHLRDIGVLYYDSRQHALCIVLGKHIYMSFLHAVNRIYICRRCNRTLPNESWCEVVPLGVSFLTFVFV